MFWSEIGSGFKEPDGTAPSRILMSAPPRTELRLSNISLDTHARINEIKRGMLSIWEFLVMRVDTSPRRINCSDK